MMMLCPVNGADDQRASNTHAPEFRIDNQVLYVGKFIPPRNDLDLPGRCTLYINEKDSLLRVVDKCRVILGVHRNFFFIWWYRGDRIGQPASLHLENKF